MRKHKGLRTHLIHGYCPACFKPNKNEFSEISLDDSRLDKVQVFHALDKRNGLRLLDLSNHGKSEVCSAGCQMLCLVCAQPVLFSDEDDFDLAINHLCPSDFQEDEPRRQSVLRRIAIRKGLRLTSRWSTFVHARLVAFLWLETRGARIPTHLTLSRCAVRSRTCSCWIPSTSSGCTTHPFVPRKGRETSKQRRRWGRMLDSDPEDDPPMMIHPQMSVQVAPVSTKPASSTSPAPKACDKTWSNLMVRMKPDAPKGALKKVPRKKEPTPKKVYSDGSTESQKREWLPRDEWLAQRKKTEQGDDGFDIRVHGYWLTKNRGLVYRCPDGRELPATGVDAFGK